MLSIVPSVEASLLSLWVPSCSPFPSLFSYLFSVSYVVWPSGTLSRYLKGSFYPSSFMCFLFVFIRVSFLVRKHYNQEQLGEERVYFSLQSHSTVHYRERSVQEHKGRNWSRNHGRTLVTSSLPVACSAWFIIHPMTTRIDHRLMKCTTDLCMGQSGRGIFSIHIHSSQMNLAPVKLTYKRVSTVCKQVFSQIPCEHGHNLPSCPLQHVHIHPDLLFTRLYN